ncbi:hypothetical protein HG531_002179 [Fusarium graminearum]|nr:hypothetical protein HG531_002179 [Fusarium graminearum]
MLALSGLGPTKESGHNAIAGVKTSRQVCHCNTNLYWRTIPFSGDVHKTKFGFHHNVVACPACYADSPGPFADDPSLYLAYGGPHALVSSPRVGCSILITSALHNANALEWKSGPYGTGIST